MVKAKLVVLTEYYFPATAAGGPPKGIRAALLNQPDLDVSVFCRDRDHLSSTPFGHPYRETVTVDQARVVYVSSQATWSTLRSIGSLLAALRQADAIWVNSLHSRLVALPWLLLLARSKAAILLSPRGELADTALASNRKRVKQVWRAILRILRVDRRVLWIASSQREASEIRKVFRRSEVFLMPERTMFDEQEMRLKPVGKRLRLLTLGRICRIKGLDIGFEVLSHVQAELQLDIVGPIEDEDHFRHLQAVGYSLAPRVEVRWHDPVDTAAVPELIRRSDALFHPTRSENFGHAIAESLALGRPVIVGPDTPWSFAEGTGAVLVLDPERPADSAAKIDELAIQTKDQSAARQLSARAVGMSGLVGDGDLTAAVRRAQSGRRPRYRVRRSP